MSYSVYEYPSSGSSYDAYSQQYDPQPYDGSDQQAQLPHYDYTSTQSLDQYAQPAATVPTDYGGYSSITDTGYTSPPVLSYPDATSSHTSYQYNQDSVKVDQFSPRSSDNIPSSFSVPVSPYSGGTITQDQATSQPVSDYSSYQYQPTDYNQPSSSFGQDSTSTGYTGSYSQNNSSYSYQNEPSQSSSTWTSNDQYTSYNPGYHEESASSISYHQKVESGYGNTDYSPSVDRYSQGNSVDTAGGSYSQSDRYSVIENSSYQGYVKPISSQASKPQYDFAAYSTPSQFNRGSEQNDTGGSKSYSSERGSVSVEPLSRPTFYSGAEGRQGGRSYFQGGNRDNFGNSSNRFTGGQKISYPTDHIPSAQRSFNNNQNAGRGSSFSARSFSDRGVRESAFSNRGKFNSYNHGDRRSNVSKPPLVAFDARNKINEARSASTAPNKLTRNLPTPNRNTNLPVFNKNKMPVSSFKPPESSKKEVFKAPSRPQDRLLNEIEEKEKAQKAEELKKSEEEQKKAEEKRFKDLEEAKKKADEALRKKVVEEAVKAAPPSKVPETAEEIAHEEEIQRKIRESLVIINPEKEVALLKDDPSKEIDMSEELRTLLKSQTTDYLCKLCSVRIVGPQMATMHYNGKNHFKKLRNFVQTNGRSAGFNLGTVDKPKKDEQEKETAEEKKAEIVENTEIDQKKYCNICKVSFSQQIQAEMHYKGKNHAKKIRSIGTGNGPDVFECKICCVTATAQEHLTAHLNGARHRQQVRKLDAVENYRGTMRSRGRGFRGRGRGGRDVGKVRDGDWMPQPDAGTRGRGFRGRGHAGSDFIWRGPGIKRRGGFNDGLPYNDGPSFFKRPRF